MARSTQPVLVSNSRLVGRFIVTLFALVFFFCFFFVSFLLSWARWCLLMFVAFRYFVTFSSEISVAPFSFFLKPSILSRSMFPSLKTFNPLYPSLNTRVPFHLLPSHFPRGFPLSLPSLPPFRPRLIFLLSASSLPGAFMKTLACPLITPSFTHSLHLLTPLSS